MIQEYEKERYNDMKKKRTRIWKKGNSLWKRKAQGYEKERYKQMKKKGNRILKRKIQEYEKKGKRI